MSGLDSATATAPTEELFSCPSVTAAHVTPLSVVFQRPPPTAPKYASFGRPFTPLTAIDRPPRSGPTLRQRYDEKNADSEAGSTAGAAAGTCCADAPNLQPAVTRMRPNIQNEKRFMPASLT